MICCRVAKVSIYAPNSGVLYGVLSTQYPVVTHPKIRSIPLPVAYQLTPQRLEVIRRESVTYSGT